MRYVSTYASPLGSMLMASDGTVLTGLWFEGQRHFVAGVTDDAERRELPVFDEAAAWLDEYFAGRTPAEAPEVAPEGTPFQRSVWDAIQTVPYGSVVTYGELAERLERSTSARAVGGAVGKNPISIVIPCHRVVGAGGSLTGYAGGAWRKRALIALERDGIRIEEVGPRPASLLTALVDVWQRSVRTSDLSARGRSSRMLPYASGYLANVATLLVARHEGHEIGFLGIDEAGIETVFVDPDWRGRGIGRMLVERAVNVFGARDAAVGEDSPQATAFFAHLGFATWPLMGADEDGLPVMRTVMRLIRGSLGV